MAHDLKVEIMHPGLVQDNVREFGETIFDVLNPAVADDSFPFQIARLPERCLVDPIGLLLHTLAEAKSFEHFHRPASNAVCLPEKEGARLLIDNPGLNLRKSRQLCRERQTGWTAPHDENINLFG